MSSTQVAQTLVKITAKMGLLTMQALLEILRKSKGKILKASPIKGEQTLNDLMSQNRTLDSIPVTSVDIKNMTEALKEYGVDFAVSKRRGTDEYTLFFKASDTAVISSAFDDILREAELTDREQHINSERNSDLDKDKDKMADLTEQEQEPLDILTQRAVAQAHEMNGNIENRNLDRTMDKSLDR